MTRLLLLALLAVSNGAIAQWRDWPPDPQWSTHVTEEPPPLQRATFAALDTDFDFRLSREEAALSRPVARNFDNADLDRDGRLSALEFNNIALALSVEDTVVQ